VGANQRGVGADRWWLGHGGEPVRSESCDDTGSSGLGFAADDEADAVRPFGRCVVVWCPLRV
jgi:hypothetical protein